MDKLGDPATMAAGAAILTSVGGLIYTTNKISEIRKDLDEVTGHLATTIGEKGTVDKLKSNIDNLGKAVYALNLNVGEVVNVMIAEQNLRDQQFKCVLGFMEGIGEVSSEATDILKKRIQIEPPAPTVPRRENGFHNHEIPRGKSSIAEPIGDRRANLSRLGI